MFAIRKPYKGFTLIELVIGIVTLSIVLLLMTGTLFPQAARGIDPWFQVRSSELALSFMNEILAKDYDENVTVAGGQQRCNDGSGGNCTDLSNCGGSEEGANRSLFDDVDDYNCLTLTENDITNISGGNSGLYTGYTVSVTVAYAGDELDTDTNVVDLDNEDAKRITVTVTPPTGRYGNQPIVFTAYRTNY